MEIVWTIVKCIAANILVVMVSSKLIVFIVRGIIQPRERPTHGLHKSEWYMIGSLSGIILSLIAIVAFGFLLSKIYYRTNPYIALSVVLLMVGRVKDLLTEIKTGVKTTIKHASKDVFDVVLLSVTWIAFAVLNYVLYKYLLN